MSGLCSLNKDPVPDGSEQSTFEEEQPYTGGAVPLSEVWTFSIVSPSLSLLLLIAPSPSSVVGKQLRHPKGANDVAVGFGGDVVTGAQRVGRSTCERTQNNWHDRVGDCGGLGWDCFLEPLRRCKRSTPRTLGTRQCDGEPDRCCRSCKGFGGAREGQS